MPTQTTIKDRKEQLLFEMKASIIKSDKDKSEKKAILATLDSFSWSYLELERLHETLI